MIKGRVLLLNQSFEVLGTIGVARAIRMTLREENPVIVHEYVPDTYLTSAGGEKFPVPSVVSLKHYVNITKRRQESGAKRVKIYIRDGYRCLVEGSLVLCENWKLKPIEEISVGDKVIDKNGDLQLVEAVYSKEVSEQVVTFNQRCNNTKLSVTKDHILFKYDKLGNEYEVFAENLKTTDYISRPIFKGFEHIHDSIDLLKYSDNLRFIKEVENDKLKHYSGNLVNRYVKLDNDFGRLIGYFLAEGSAVGNTVTFSFNINETIYHEDVVNLIKKFLGLDAVIRKYTSNNQACIVLGCSIFANFLRKFCYKNGEKRHESKNYPIEYLKGVLCGLMRGDGHFSSKYKKASLHLKVDNLVNDAYLISLILGLNPSLGKYTIDKRGKGSKKLIFNANEYNKMLEIANIDLPMYEPIANRKTTDLLFKKGRVLGKVQNLKEEFYAGKVYDIRVSNSNSFVANFMVVHNCGYCAKHFDGKNLTLDHIVPRSKGGLSIPENLVSACKPCNQRKADRTPEQANMPLLTHIHDTRDIGLDKIMICRYLENRPEWRPYIEGQPDFQEYLDKVA